MHEPKQDRDSTPIEPVPGRDPVSQSPPFLVAGVGASAGGLEAFSRLVRAIPADAPMAIVLVQHLPRDHESLLPELLAAKTELAVADAVDGQRLLPRTVYVIRPDTQMAVIDGRLSVRRRPSNDIHDGPIDHLFESMAEQYRERALGVVLSGAGSDGAAGLRRIRSVGGITLAQEPQEAQVDAMPRAAIATGAVDLVLPLEKLAAELVRLAEHSVFQRSLGEEPSDDADLQQILRVLRRMTGVDFAHYKTPTIRRRMQRRMALHRMSDFASYLELLKQSVEEARSLHDDILIHVTSFFREPESFEVLKQSVLPDLLREKRGDGPIRAWVPGCSSGEEAYSLAIVLTEVMEELELAQPIVVFGTDLSQRMVERARSGHYPESIAADVTPERLRRFFSKVEDGYRVSGELRERCVFAHQDITRDPPFSKLDLLLCRNLLIYLGQPVQRKLGSIFHYALSPHGVLVLGRSETIGSTPELFSVVDGRWKIYRRRAGKPLPVDFELGASPSGTPNHSGSKFGRPYLRERSARDLQHETNRQLLDRYAPPLVIVDDALRVLRSSGRTSPFLELPSGEASLDLLKMVRSGLMAPLRSAIQEARGQTTPARREGIEFRSGDVLRAINLEVSRVANSDNHLLILFEDPSLRAAAPATSAPLLPLNRDSAIEQLEHELMDTRAELQAMIQDLETANEELQSANEEILSSNEELQSTNEELDTAREELQSSNEELGTVNDELQTRNLELSHANGDLLNLLASVEIPIVIVSAELRIRRFTPAAERALNLIAADVGRPIAHIKPNIGYPDLELVMHEVIDSGAIREREVEDHEGRTYLATIRPYRNVANRIDGAVLALFDVSAALKVAHETGEAVISTVRDPILLLDSNLLVRRANRAFCTKFSLTPQETEGRSVFELGNARWNVPTLRRLLQEVLPEHKNFDDFPVEYAFPGVGTKKLLLDGRRIESSRLNDSVILLIIREVADAAG